MISNNAEVSIDRETATVQVNSNATASSATIQLTLADGTVIDQVVIIEDTVVGVRTLDPILSSLRVSLEEREGGRLLYGSVNLEILSRLFFFKETSELTASAILIDGRRVVIDPAQLSITSLNASVVSVEANQITAEGSGVVLLNVTWSVCPGEAIEMALLEVDVEFDSHRPLFSPDTQRAEVPEDSRVGYSIARVVAQDLDFAADPTASDIEYRVMQPDPFSGLFIVDTLTGEVILNGPLDREVVESYTLLIEATDRQQRLSEQEGVASSGSGSGAVEGMLMPNASDVSRLMVRACMMPVPPVGGAKG